MTHSLFGLTLARTPLGRTGQGTTLALLLASNAPDIDIIATAGGTARYLEWHRGPTHGMLGIVGLGLLVALLVRATGRWWKGDHQPASLAMLWMVSCAGIVAHILMDVPTSYGTRLLSPFAWTWFAKDWMPIVDVYLLAILAGCLLIGRRMPAFRSRSVVLALTLMLALYGLRAAAHRTAIVRAPEVFGARLPALCPEATPAGFIDRWPRGVNDPRSRHGARCLVEIVALPDFVSPFRWRLIAQLSNAYEVRVIDVLKTSAAGTALRLESVHVPNQWTPAVQKAAAGSIARIFLGFSRFPSARSVINKDGSVRVRWTDVRFDTTAEPGPRQGTGSLFAVTIDVEPDGRILRERFGS